MTLMMTSAQVVKTSVNVTNNSPSWDYSHPDDQTTQTTETPGFKPFTVASYCCLQKQYRDVQASAAKIMTGAPAAYDYFDDSDENTCKYNRRMA